MGVNRLRTHHIANDTRGGKDDMAGGTPSRLFSPRGGEAENDLSSDCQIPLIVGHFPTIYYQVFIRIRV